MYTTRGTFKSVTPAQAAPAAQPHKRRRLPDLQLRLDVAHDIRRSDLPIFTESGHQLVNIIEGTGELKLLLSCWDVQNEIVRIYNYWELHGGLPSLIRAERELLDNPLFVPFDRLMVAETKDLVAPLNGAGIPVENHHERRFVYARATYQVPTVQLAEFNARLEASTVDIGQTFGWALGDTYLGLTGRAGTVVQTWVIPEDTALLAHGRLTAGPWQSLLATAPEIQILEPTPSDPMLGLIPRERRPKRTFDPGRI